MTNQQLLNKIQKTKIQKIGQAPVVVLPIEDWKALENILEDYEMACSSHYRRSVKVSRQQVGLGKLYEFNPKTGLFKRARRRK